MDRGPDTTGGHRSRVLDDILRQIADEKGHRCGVCFRITPRGPHEVHGSAPFPPSNNVAEYKALVNSLRIAIELGIRRLDIRGNS